MGFLEKLLRKGDTSEAVDLQVALSKLSLADAEAAVATLERERRALLLDGTDAQVAAMDERIALANRQVERVSAAREALAERIAAARTASDDAERRQRYADAQRAQDAAARRLLTEYPKHARALTGLLRLIAEADILARAANEALPQGAARLGSCEARVRREADAPAEIIADEVRSAWCWASGHRLSPDQVEAVKVDADGVTGAWQSPHQPPKPVYLRRFRHITRIPETFGRDIASLANTLNLPPLAAGHVPFWTPSETYHPESVVHLLDDATAKWGRAFGQPGLYAPGPETEVIPLDDPGEIAA